MVAARRAMARMVDTLGDADRFAVFAFDDRDRDAAVWASDVACSPPPTATGSGPSSSWRSSSRGAAPRSPSRSTRPSGCSTSVAMTATAFSFWSPTGRSATRTRCSEVLGARLKGIRVFTLGIDQAVNEGFLRRLAELGQGGGSCELVESEDRLDAVMDAIHRRIGTPVVTDVCLESGRRPGSISWPIRWCPIGRRAFSRARRFCSWAATAGGRRGRWKCAGKTPDGHGVARGGRSERP